MMSIGQALAVARQSQQVMNNQNSQQVMNQLVDLSRMMMDQSQGRSNNRGGGFGMWPTRKVDQFEFKNQNVNPSGYARSPLTTRNNKYWKMKKANYGDAGNYNPPILKESLNHNRLKSKRNFSKTKFNHGGKSAPFAPRNTSSFLIRVKKSGGITSSPSPITPAVLPTPIFSPSREILVDTAKKQWGVDGYGSMKGLIRLRSPGNDEDEKGVSSERGLEEHLEVERRLDHDLSRFEMIYRNYGVADHTSCLLNRVDDQHRHITQLEEKNLMLKEKLFLMERGFNNLRSRLQSLEMQRQGEQGSKVV